MAWLGRGALIALGSLSLALSAHYSIPFWPVPMTMQTLVLLLIGLIYRPWLGGVTVLVYLVQGALGLPVFAGGAGLAYMAGPTGGYLAGFLLACVLVGLLSTRRRNPLALLGIALLGEAAIFGLGWAWLAILVGPEKAFAAGVMPFLLAEALKALTATALAHRLARLRMHA